jgi:hypothetical protein
LQLNRAGNAKQLTTIIIEREAIVVSLPEVDVASQGV